MTIYDQDYMAEANLQHQYTGVVDSAAVSPVAVEETPKEAVDQVADAHEENTALPDVSEKHYNFKALRETIAREQAEREAERLRYQQDIDFMRSQLAQKPVQENRKVLEDERDDDLLTVGKFRQTQAAYENQLRQQEENYRLKLNELETKVQHSDYDEVMDKYAIPLLKNNRDFAIAFQNSENKASFAYNLGRMMKDSQPRPQAPVETEGSQKAQRIVENSNKPGTLSSARGGQPSLSKAEYYGSMSDADFNALVEKNLTEV